MGTFIGSGIDGSLCRVFIHVYELDCVGSGSVNVVPADGEARLREFLQCHVLGNMGQEFFLAVQFILLAGTEQPGGADGDCRQ